MATNERNKAEVEAIEQESDDSEFFYNEKTDEAGYSSLDYPGM